MKQKLAIFILSIIFSVIVLGCGSDNTAKTQENKTIASQTTATTTPKPQILGLTEEEFIKKYNKAMDNSIKQCIVNAAYYKIDKAKIKDKTIVLDGVATLAWHTEDDSIDAVTFIVENAPKGLSVPEGVIIAAITNDKELFNNLLNRVNSNERKIEINKGNIFVIRLSDTKLRKFVLDMYKGISR